MKTEFKLWSESNPDTKEKISPKIGMREWDELTTDDKERMLKHFTQSKWFIADYHNFVFRTIFNLNSKYKNSSYGRYTLNHNGPHYRQDSLKNCCIDNALTDFYKIFREQKQDVVYEMLSIYAELLILKDYLKDYDNTEDENQRKLITNQAYELFDEFSNLFNDISQQFGLNIMQTRNGYVLKQDEKITDEIYIPVINYLSDKRWEQVIRELKDAFDDYQKGTEQEYSSCVTHAISALQAFLQLLIQGKTGKGEISSLITVARNKELIPKDKFTEKIFKNIESILMFERQETGDPHPKREYATEKNARLVLNLIMIFLQHCIQS
ncbi:MAG: hypothetical protein ISS16_09310 [Ignavibacteria bacterium]|nr:hypothetical protein [Ignavibacteria bacterium]